MTGPLTVDAQWNSLKTWRYLRLSIVILVLGLFASIAHEIYLAPGHCVQNSISAYYYTPTRGFFAGSLVAIGVCLFAIQGSTAWEDLWLNLAGVCAPIVALVPTANADKACASVASTNADRIEGIGNSMVTLLVVGALVLLVCAGLALVARPGDGDALTWQNAVAWAVGALLWITLLMLFWRARGFVDVNLHWIAAIGMFTFAGLAIALNVWDRKARNQPLSQRLTYAALLGVMVLAAIVHGALAIAHVDFPNLVFSAELCEIVPFAAFWAVQTVHLWYVGMRP